MAEYCLDIGGEDEPVGQAHAVQWLDPEVIAGGQEHMPARVMKHEREHPVEPADEVWPVLEVHAEKHFSIRPRAEAVSQGFQFAEQLEAAVGTPVELWDERLTTTMAAASRREGATADEDSLAAAHLLEHWLAAHENSAPDERAGDLA